MIVVQNLVKRYGAREAVRDLSFSVKKGEIVGFLGPNGAGKSTTLRVLAGYLAPTTGTVRVAGHDVEKDPIAAKACVGYMPEMVPLYPEMRVIEYLDFRAELKGVPRAKRRERVGDVLEKARITEVAHVVVGSLSKGYRQRVGLADALVADPPLLILDEPTAGLDPNQIREVRDVVAGLRGSHTVLLSTHILSEVEASCGRAIVIAKGKLVAEGTLAELREKRTARGVRATLDGSREAVQKVLAEVRKSLPKLSEEPTIVTEEGLVSVVLSWEKEASSGFREAQKALAKALVEAGLGLVSLAPVQGRLEDVFAELTQTTSRDEADEATDTSEAEASS
jgi:ABC-2 type transport system ATP-binding protein